MKISPLDNAYKNMNYALNKTNVENVSSKFSYDSAAFSLPIQKNPNLSAAHIKTHSVVNFTGSILADDKLRLGANYDKKRQEVNFKLASENATAVQLCIFDKPQGEDAIMNVMMNKGKNNIWEISVPKSKLNNLEKPVYYGYRVFGPNWEYTQDFQPGTSKGFNSRLDQNGNRFNPNRLAYDPYSRELSHVPSDSEKGFAVFGGEEELTSLDNARWAPKTVFNLNDDTIIPRVKTIRPLTSEIIGEVHLKDLTQKTDLKDKGTYKAAGEYAQTLKDIGVTMVEFLPLQEFDPKDTRGNSNCLGNHWGYMTENFFAPSKRYSQSGKDGKTLSEFRDMIKAFHEKDLKVCMDVVYNHTGEGGNRNPADAGNANLMSYALIDNATYYKQKDGMYTSNSGCGNDINAAKKPVMELVADSIAFWAKQGVDAFRFDLAVGLMDTDETHTTHYDNKESIVGKLEEMLKERGVKVNAPNEASEDGISLIAEPWTCGGEYTYQLGNFPSKWAEWNDYLRDTVKLYSIAPKEVNPQRIKDALEGTPNKNLNGDKAINYLCSHDGFTLNDANSYDRDGWTGDRASAHNGDKTAQEAAMKQQLALLMCSKGTAMVQVGDLIAHSKGGDKNSYDKDNDTNYLDWSKSQVEDSREKRFSDFSKSIIKFRKEHPSLREVSYNKDMKYFDESGTVIKDSDKNYWKNNEEDYIAFKTSDSDPVFVASSKSEDSMEIALPENKPGKHWELVFNTALEDPFNNNTQTKMNENSYVLPANAVAAFVEK